MSFQRAFDVVRPDSLIGSVRLLLAGKAVDAVVSFWRSEPAVVIGAAVSLLLLLGTEVAALEALAPAVAGWLARWKVTPA